MMRQCIQMLAAWLAHPEHGINALAAQLPHDGEAAAPTVKIYNTADDKGVRRQVLDVPSVPAVVVFGDSILQGKPRGHRESPVTLGVGFVTDDAADEDAAAAAAGAIHRAILNSTSRFSQERVAKAYRSKNGIVIASVNRVEYAEATAAKGRFRLWGLDLVDVTAADVSAPFTPAMPFQVASA